MDCKKIGSYIQSKRKKLGITQSELGEMVGVTDKAVSKWECGVALPDVTLLQDLANIFNIEVSELLNGEDSQKEVIIQKENKKNKILLITLISISSILFILVLFLGYYFINNYDKVHVYDLVGEKDSFYAEGKLITIGDENYLFLSNISYNGNDENMHCVYDFSYEILYKNEVVFKKKKYNQNRNSYDFLIVLKNLSVFSEIKSDFDFYPVEYFDFKVNYINCNYEEKGFVLKLKIVE